MVRVATTMTALHDGSLLWGVAMSDPETFRATARDYAVKARLAKSHDEWHQMRRIAKSFLLLEQHAKWLRSTDHFLEALKTDQRWPAPEPAAAVQDDLPPCAD